MSLLLSSADVENITSIILTEPHGKFWLAYVYISTVYMCPIDVSSISQLRPAVHIWEEIFVTEKIS